MTRFLSLGLLSLLAAGCHHPEPSPAPTPPSLTVRVRADIQGIAPQYNFVVSAIHYSQGKYKKTYFQASYTQDHVTDTREITPDLSLPTDSLQLLLSAPGPYAGYNMPIGSSAQVDILVNGQVRKSILRDYKTPVSSRSPYIEQVVYLPFQGLGF